MKDPGKDGVHISKTGGNYCLDCGKLLKAPPTQIREAIELLVHAIRNDGWNNAFNTSDEPWVDQILALIQARGTDLLKSDLGTNSRQAKAQLKAEYKQLLNELPLYFASPDIVEYHAGFNDCLDQCRAIIQRHIDELA